MFEALEAWFSSAAWPAIKTFFGGVVSSEVAAVTPIAEQAVSTLAVDEAAALASGDTKNTGKILAGIVSTTVPALETAGIKASIPSVMTAIGAAAANAPALVAAAQPAQQQTA